MSLASKIIRGILTVTGKIIAASVSAETIQANRVDEASAAASYIYDTGDGFMRKKTLANARAELVTAADILAKIKTVDGAGSGVDADTLDGNEASYFLASASYTAADVLAKIKTVDGSGSGLDADTLDGFDSSNIQRSMGDVSYNVQPTKNGTYRVVTTGTGMLYPAQYGIGSAFCSNASGGCYTLHLYAVGTNLYCQNTADGNGITAAGWKKVWTETNDGSGSGLDADMLDGCHAFGTYQTSGVWIPTIPYNGPLEIGRFLDFHMVGSSADFDARMSLDDNKSFVFADGRGSYYPMSLGLSEDVPGRKVFFGGIHDWGTGTDEGLRGSIEVRGPGNTSPTIMTFHRPGQFATYFGLDSDNQFKFGGWSNGAGIKYPFLWNSSGQGGKVTQSTADPSGGQNGDIWIKYNP